MDERILVISDIHGCYSEFCDLLKQAKYNPQDDKLILLGDYIDRGNKSKQVVEAVMGLVQEWNAIALVGNHDRMFIDWVLSSDYDYKLAEDYFLNGGMQTINSYCGLDWYEIGYDSIDAKNYILEHYRHHVEFLENLPYYYETDEFIFVHAGINPLYKDWKQTSKNDMIWIRDLFIDNLTQTDKTVIFGHTPTIHLHGKEDVYFGGDKIGIDGGCVFGFQLNCLEISDDGYKTYFVSKYK